MKISSAGPGARIRLNLAESHVLEQVLRELQGVLAPGALEPGDPVRARLYPAGYRDDPAAAADFRQLTESTLQTERSERVDQCLAEVLQGRTLRRTEIQLDADATERWLRVVNDVRLTFGTRLGISDEEDYELDRHDPQVHVRARYLWLTAFQDALVVAVMG